MGVYNDVARVQKAVASITEQTLRELELIVVDDGSHDGSAALLDRLAAQDPRVVVVHQENSGLTRALIRGCEMARGEYIARQDSDDWSHPQRLAEQVALLDQDRRVGFVSCATQYVGPGDEPLVVVRRAVDPVQATRGLLEGRQGPPAHGSVMFRASSYRDAGGYRSEFLFSQDSDLWLRMAGNAMIGYLPEIRYFHRKALDSTSGANRRFQARFAELGHACRRARDQGLDETPMLSEAAALGEELRSRRGGMPKEPSGELAVAYLVGSQLAKNRDARARDYLWQVLRARPWHWKAWIRLAQSYAGAARRA
jgi:glycosyltransferase involved in cell wall biosynthesis